MYHFFKHFLFIALLLSGGALNVFGQLDRPESDFYSINDGLSSRLINDMVLGSDGMVWLGTENGLNRFDGYEFITFSPNSVEDEFKISSHRISRLEETKDKKMIIFYINTIRFFDVFDMNSYQTKKVELLPKFGLKGVPKSTFLNSEGEAYIYTRKEDRGSIYRYNTIQDSFQLQFTLPDHSGKGARIDLMTTSNGFFFVNDSESGLTLFDAKGNLLKSFHIEDFLTNNGAVSYPQSYYFLKEDVNSRIWLSLKENNRLFLFDPVDLIFRAVNIDAEGAYFTGMHTDEMGNAMFKIGLPSGQYAAATQMQCVTKEGIIEDFSNLINISENIVSCTSQNFFQNIFLGIDTGLEVVYNNRSKVKNYLDENVGQSHRGAVMRGIVQTPDLDVYLAREFSGWYRYDEASEVLDTVYLMDEKNGQVLDYTCGVNIVYDESRNSIWGAGCLGGTNSNMIEYDLESCLASTAQMPFQVKAFDIDAKMGVLWIGGLIQDNGVLATYDPVTAQVHNFEDDKGENPFENAIPNYLLVDGDVLWVGTDKGLYRVEMSSGEVHLSGNKKAQFLNTVIVYCIYKDSKGLLWVGTQNGLVQYNPENEKVLIYDKEDGLASNNVCGIIEDEDYNFWISTYNGLSYFEPNIQQFKNFYKEDGLSHDEFNRFSFLRSSSGINYLGTVNGFNVFNNEDLIVQKLVPKVRLSRFYKYNSRLDSLIVMVSNLSNLEEITISPYDNFFVFDFCLPVYKRPHKNQFRYYLSGYDKTWNYLGANHSLRYNKLPAGRYTLYVKGADVNGNWSSTDLQIKLHVKQIFYKTKAFILLAIALMLGLGYLFFQNRLEQKLRVERLRAKLASDLHDELSGLLAGIAMQTDILADTASGSKQGEKLKKIGADSRNAMSRMSDVIWSVDSRKDKVEDFVVRMQEHADEILLPLDIAYEINNKNLPLDGAIPVEIRQDLYFIYKELINNVAKHSNARRVFISLNNNGKLFKMTIRDNGDGDQSGTSRPKGGQGLKNVQMRAKRIGANLTFLKDDGYTVILSMDRFVL